MCPSFTTGPTMSAVCVAPSVFNSSSSASTVKRWPL
jgi:hypothetical protein